MTGPGVMTHAEAVRLYHIGGVLHREHKISNDDLDWAIRLLHSKPVISTEKNRSKKIRRVISNLGGLNSSFTAAQLKKRTQAIFPFLRDKDALVRASAVIAMMHEKRAIPQLLRMQQDSDSLVRHWVSIALQDLQTTARASGAQR